MMDGQICCGDDGFCETPSGFVPAYENGKYVLCEFCFQKELDDDKFHRPWAHRAGGHLWDGTH